jgi:hypothetical protein
VAEGDSHISLFPFLMKDNTIYIGQYSKLCKILEKLEVDKTILKARTKE